MNMISRMKLASSLIAGITSIHMTSAFATEDPVAWWSFDANEGRQDAIIGHHEIVPGVRGLALRSNEFETTIECEAGSLPSWKSGAFTVEAWIAPRAFPWNYCPIIEQRDQTNGFYFGINYQGQLQLEVSIGGKWVRCESRAALPGLDANLRFASENSISKMQRDETRPTARGIIK